MKGLSQVFSALILLIIIITTFALLHPIIFSQSEKALENVEGMIERGEKSVKLRVSTVYAFKDENGITHIMLWNHGKESVKIIMLIVNLTKLQINEVIGPGEYWTWEGITGDDVIIIFEGGYIYEIKVERRIKFSLPEPTSSIITTTGTITQTRTETQTTTTTETITMTETTTGPTYITTLTTTTTNTLTTTITSTITYASYTTTTTTITTTRTFTTTILGPLIYLINIIGAPSSYTSRHTFIAGIEDAANRKGINIIEINTWNRLKQFFKNPPDNIIVINAHGSILPKPDTFTSSHEYINRIAENIMNHKWVWVSVESVPFNQVYDQSTNSTTLLGNMGIVWFLNALGAPASISTGLKQFNINIIGQSAWQSFGYNPVDIIGGARSFHFSQLSPIVVRYYNPDSSIYDGGFALKPPGGGAWVYIATSIVGEFVGGKSAVVFGWTTAVSYWG